MTVEVVKLLNLPVIYPLRPSSYLIMRDSFASGSLIFNLSDLSEQIKPVGLVLSSEFERSLLLDF